MTTSSQGKQLKTKAPNARALLLSVANWLGDQEENLSSGLRSTEDAVKLYLYAQAHPELDMYYDEDDMTEHRIAALGYDPIDDFLCGRTLDLVVPSTEPVQPTLLLNKNDYLERFFSSYVNNVKGAMRTMSKRALLEYLGNFSSDDSDDDDRDNADNYTADDKHIATASAASGIPEFEFLEFALTYFGHNIDPDASTAPLDH